MASVNDTKAFCSKCDGLVEHNNGRCPVHGIMCKGFSPNPKGSTRKKPKPKEIQELTEKDKKELKELITKKDMAKLSAWFAERASTADIAFKYVKELAPYIAPKLSSIQSEIKQDTSIKIEIAGFEALTVQNDAKVIEGTAEEITQEEEASEEPSA